MGQHQVDDRAVGGGRMPGLTPCAFHPLVHDRRERRAEPVGTWRW
jgi:hypothetical protein